MPVAQDRPPLTAEQQRLVADHLPLAMSIAGRMARGRDAYSEANRDAAVDGLMKAASYYDPTRCPDFADYAATLVRQTIIDQIRSGGRGRRRPASAFVSLESIGPQSRGDVEPESPDRTADFDDDPTDPFDRLLFPLRPLRAEVLRLRYRDGLAYQAIADRLGFSLPYVFHLHSQAIAELRRRLEPGDAA